MKRTLALFLCATVVAAPNISHAEDQPLPAPVTAEPDEYSSYWTNESWSKQNPHQGKELFLGYGEVGSIGTTNHLAALDKNNEWISVCKEIGQAPCDAKSLNSKKIRIWSPGLVMPLCAKEASPDCVESLTMIQPDGTEVPAEFIRSVAGITFEKNADFKLPKTSTQLLFRAPGVLNAAGTDTYVVEYSQVFYWNRMTPDLQDLKVAVVPYVEEDEPSAKTQVIEKGPMPDGKGQFTATPWNMPLGVAWMEDGKVGRIANFADGVGARVVIHASKKFGGWFRGRLSGASFDAQPLGSSQQRITIGGTSVEIPRIGAWVNRAQFLKYTKEPVEIFDRHVGNGGNGVGGDVSDPDGMFVWLNAIKAVSKDKAIGVNRNWMFATVQNTMNAGCFATDGVHGMVATNSAIYAGGAPKYSGGFLTYRVAGLHNLPDGTEAIGTYDLVMRSDIARCLYRFNKAPVSGTITVAGEGDTNIATTTVGEKNGWLRLSANGFTFSSKTIKVKLTQKKTTITCVAESNPKKTKKVTGYSPKCPAGFKKK